MTSFFTTAIILLLLLMQAIEPIVIKMALKEGHTTLDLLIYRFVLGGIMVLPFCTHFKWIGWKALKKLLPLCLLFLVVNSLIYLALQTLSAITVITFITTTPALVALVNQKKGKEQLSPLFWPGFFLCFFGVLITVEAFRPNAYDHITLEGLFFILLAIVGSTLYRTTMDQTTKNHSPLLISNYLFLTNTVMVTWAFPLTDPAKRWEILPWGAWLSFASVVANVAFLWALKKIGSTRISLLTILQRPLLFLFSALFLGEPFGWPQGVGLVMILGGLQLTKVHAYMQGSPKVVDRSLSQNKIS